jgi:cation:H+ antiporter
LDGIYPKKREVHMNFMIAVSIIGGLVILVAGAEFLVRGASRLAAALGISPLVIGLTVVAFGTSAPELAINMQSAFLGEADIALGNVVGSNIFNILVILGISALIVPLVVHQQLIQLDIPIMIGISVAVYVMSLDGRLDRLDGLLLASALALYLYVVYKRSRQESKDIQEEYAHEFGIQEKQTSRNIFLDLGMMVGGLAMLVFGARWLVDGAVAVALYFNVSELVIGLTLVAAGTSLPEVATSVVAALRNERDIAVGNAVGSNIFNLLSVLGLTSLIAPNGIPVPDVVLRFDLPVMIAVALATLPIAFTGKEIARWEGGLFFAYYIAYTAFILIETLEHHTYRQIYLPAMLWFVVPLTLITLVVTVIQERKRQETA